MASSHKPRAKGKRVKTPTSYSGNGSSYLDASANIVRPAFPLASFLWPTRGVASQSVILPLILMVTGLFRWALGLWKYSGYESPPMHGDFEAQRHWMEITIHLPISRWYFHDLGWWGLDYPPLTAYHSWALGKLGSLIDPAWFALGSSRGLDDSNLKIYMRATVLVSEYLVFVPSLVILLRHLARSQGVHTWESSVALVAILMQPGTLLIDHAHFQYNTVMLGFVLASISNFYAGRRLWSSIFFVAALGFKQMALYYAPAIFAALLSVCFFPSLNVLLLLRIAMVTALSFLVLFAPLLVGSYLQGAVYGTKGDILPVTLPDLPSGPFLARLRQDTTAWYFPLLQQLSQSVHRIFPFARGIFEDKVANLWCTLNVFIKLRQYPISLLQRISLVATLASIIPPCSLLFVKPGPDNILYALAATGWGFFLCSFQVHEKSVLLPLLPMTLLLAVRSGATPPIRAWVGWANILGVWTMYPLLKRDELRIPYFALTLVWAYLLGLPPASPSIYLEDRQGDENALGIGTKALHLSFYSLMILWHFAEAFLPPPEGKPDLWVVLNVGIGAVGFGFCYLWCVWQGAQASGIFRSGPEDEKSVTKGKARVR